MMKRLIFFLLTLSIFACARDTATQPDCSLDGVSNQTYQEVKLILNESCAYSTCHLDGGASGTGNFDTYEALRSYFENNDVSAFVSEINSGDMPPSYAPEGKNKTISPLEILQLICWIEDGYPEE